MAETSTTQPQKQQRQKVYPHKRDERKAYYRDARMADNKGNERRRYTLCPDPKCGYPLVHAKAEMDSPTYTGERRYVCMFDDLHTPTPLTEEQYREQAEIDGSQRFVKEPEPKADEE